MFQLSQPPNFPTPPLFGPRYASPGAARAALTSLLGRRDAARRNEALYVLRGAKMAVQRESGTATEWLKMIVIQLIWLVVWNMNFMFPYIGNNHHNW